MRHWYLDCLAVMYGEVEKAPFTLSAVRPALSAEGYAVNGSVLKELCQNRYMERIPGKDMRVKGTHYVHQYRITQRGQGAAARRAGAGAVAATCQSPSPFFAAVPISRAGSRLPDRFSPSVEHHTV